MAKNQSKTSVAATATSSLAQLDVTKSPFSSPDETEKNVPPHSLAVAARLAGGTRSSKNWRSLPGSFDTVNSHCLFPTANDNPFGIPLILPPTELNLPDQLVAYRTKTLPPNTTTGLHFFLDDYRLATLWNRPYQTLLGLLQQNHQLICTPDFSLYRDWPLAIQIWNTYRNRWLGAFWQAYDLPVIPTVSWSSTESYAFCFAGIAPGSPVALSTVGINQPDSRSFFQAGFSEMVARVKPSFILCYGKFDSKLRELTSAPIVEYPTRWDTKRAALKKLDQPLKINSERSAGDGR